MNQVQKGLLFALIQVLFVSSLGAKLLWDRWNSPRGWAATQGYDPELLIRGRYVNITLLVKADKVFTVSSPGPGTISIDPDGPQNVELAVENGMIVAKPADHFTGLYASSPRVRDGELLAALSPPVVYFLPEHAADPMRTVGAGGLYLEATVPHKGPPRPIRFGRKSGSTVAPLGSE